MSERQAKRIRQAGRDAAALDLEIRRALTHEREQIRGSLLRPRPRWCPPRLWTWLVGLVVQDAPPAPRSVPRSPP